MELLSDWRFVAAAAAASFIIGMSRGGFAGGIAFVGVLIMA
ncbi:MAG: sulfite exporter TauE/SafE family protein, partial [Betaproteobacteria bacterium AqS2]|nr:sulfite exporter TauE/SafE family protein [Betaproteobacteria bacterium AqS2]